MSAEKKSSLHTESTPNDVVKSPAWSTKSVFAVLIGLTVVMILLLKLIWNSLRS
jgi:hypothetical protein